MRTVTATSRWILISRVNIHSLHSSKIVFWSVLFLRCQDSLIKKFGVLPSIERIVLHIGGSSKACALVVINWFKFILFVHSVVILIIFIIQNWVSGVHTSNSVLQIWRPNIGRMSKASSKIVIIWVLKVLWMVYKLHVVVSLVSWILMASSIEFV